jgi:hypothetical protein
MPSQSPDQRELLIPIELPKGKYPVWASFRMADSDGPPIETPREVYVVP